MSIRDYLEDNYTEEELRWAYENGHFGEIPIEEMKAIYTENEEELWESVRYWFTESFLDRHRPLTLEGLKLCIVEWALENKAEILIYEMDNPECEEEANE